MKRDPSITRFPSPLRYPGGKVKVVNFMKLVLLRNQLVGKEYVEPYAGGASVALALLYEEYASHVHINDLNRSVHAFWHAVLNDTERLCQRIHDSRPSMREWRRQRSVQSDPDADSLSLGFSTFFLNRTNRSGIITGGVIGGREQTGAWKIDARYNIAALTRRIEKVARYRNRITLTRHDGAFYLRSVLPKLPADAFCYLDPPYYVKGAHLYEHFYAHEHHAEIARLVRRLRQRWLVSYDAAPRLLSLYAGVPRIRYDLSYSATDRYRGAEVMFFGPGLVPPKVKSPANIRARQVELQQLLPKPQRRSA